MKYLVVLLFCLFLSGCKEIDFENKPRRTIDEEAGVVCWQVGPGGIDCLPIKETKLYKGE